MSFQVEISLPDKSTLTALVPSSILPKGLNEVTCHLTNESQTYVFLINNKILKGPLSSLAQSTESILKITAILPISEPAKIASFDCKDWVSSLCLRDNEITIGLFDDSIHRFDYSRNQIGKINIHSGPVKCLLWENDILLSGGADGMVYATRNNQTLFSAKHAASVNDISSFGNGFLSASCDGTIGIWDFESSVSPLDLEQASKKRKLELIEKSSLGVLSGHVGFVSGVDFNQHGVFSCGWDHSLRQFDLETRQNINTRNLDTVLTSITSLSTANLIATTSTNSKIHLSDTRSKNTTTLKCNGWISGLSFSKSSDFHFASVGYESGLLVWDLRSDKVLYKIPEPKKLFCVEWNRDIVYGGEDGVEVFEIKNL